MSTSNLGLPGSHYNQQKAMGHSVYHISKANVCDGSQGFLCAIVSFLCCLVVRHGDTALNPLLHLLTIGAKTARVSSVSEQSCRQQPSSVFATKNHHESSLTQFYWPQLCRKPHNLVQPFPLQFLLRPFSKVMFW